MAKSPVAAAPAAAASINWLSVLNQVIAAVAGVLGPKWGSVSQPATHELYVLTETARWIEENKASMDEDTYNLLVDAHKRTLHDVLVGNELIKKAIADQAVAAAWAVILTALKSAGKFPFPI